MPLPRTPRESEFHSKNKCIFNFRFDNFSFKGTYSYGHEKYDQCGNKNSTDHVYNSAAVACDSSVGSKIGK